MGHYKPFNIIKKNKVVLILIMILIGICIKPAHINATESNIVKVGYPIVSGFTEIKDGAYTGYAYDYLLEIAKYTGWEYEFVEMDLNTILEALRDGKIDLAAGMLKNEVTQEIYDFPEEDAGYTYRTLATLKDNEAIGGSNYETLNGIKVGYYEKAQAGLKKFLDFCENNEIKDVELVAYAHDGEKSLLDALKAQEVDAIIEGDLLLENEEKIVAKFESTPYYFATTKGNKSILTGLNKALSKIKESNPNFDHQLYSKYFQSYIDNTINLTQEEKDYINHMTPLKAVYVDNLAPMQNYNAKTKKAEGVYIDIMELIAEQSGLKYDLVKASNYKEAYEMIKNREVDLFISAPASHLKASKYEYALTQAYLKVNMVKVIDRNQESYEGKQIIALPKGYSFMEFEGEYEIQYYETIEECLTAVKTGKASLTYGNNYTISKYLSSGQYPNLLISFEETPIRAQIGISKPVNKILMNIINKSVSSLSDSEIKNIIYSNTVNVETHITLKQFFLANPIFGFGVILAFIFLIGIIATTKFRRLAEDKSFLLEKSQIDALTGVYNRSTGIELVTSYLQTKEPSLYSVLAIIDIDHFKQVNDQLGHCRGDDLLVEFSQLLKQIFSRYNIIFRLGGDEFMVCLTNLKSNDLQFVDKKLHELCQVMNKEVSYEGHSQKISLSIGAVVTKQSYHFNELYQEADKLLYKVKRNGRNGFKIKTLI